jgi:hypothetical protein
MRSLKECFSVGELTALVSRSRRLDRAGYRFSRQGLDWNLYALLRQFYFRIHLEDWI